MSPAIKVTKELSFDAAHRLKDNIGRCKNIHGHTYRAQIEVGVPLCEFRRGNGIVIDFDVMSEMFGPVVDRMDHSLILDRSDPMSGVFVLGLDGSPPEYKDQRLVLMDGPPTAENMALDIGLHVERLLKGSDAKLIRVKVWETPTSSATYEGQEELPCRACACRL
jgi:6-pyruvoyltetrahydropterin/6-carboxytetrahydropterin synthase